MLFFIISIISRSYLFILLHFAICIFHFAFNISNEHEIVPSLRHFLSMKWKKFHSKIREREKLKRIKIAISTLKIDYWNYFQAVHHPINVDKIGYRYRERYGQEQLGKHLQRVWRTVSVDSRKLDVSISVFASLIQKQQALQTLFRNHTWEIWTVKSRAGWSRNQR